MTAVSRFLAVAMSLWCASSLILDRPAHAQARPVLALESCYGTATVRQFRDNEFSSPADPALAGSLGLGCDLFEVKGLPLDMGLTFGVFGEVMEVAPFKRGSGLSGDILTKHMGTMGFVGGASELKLPAIGVVTPSILLRYGIEVGSLVLPRGYYVDANGWEKSFAKRYTQEIGLAGCLDYRTAVKLCLEFDKLTYDTYPHIWIDPSLRQQGRPEPITAANEISGRIVVPFSNFKK